MAERTHEPGYMPTNMVVGPDPVGGLAPPRPRDPTLSEVPPRKSLWCRLGFHSADRSQGAVGYCMRECCDHLKTEARGGRIRYTEPPTRPPAPPAPPRRTREIPVGVMATPEDVARDLDRAHERLLVASGKALCYAKAMRHTLGVIASDLDALISELESARR